MSIGIGQNGGKPYTLYGFTIKYTTYTLGYRQSGVMYFIPLVEASGSVTIGGYKYSYDPSAYPKFLVPLNNNVYYVVNKREAVQAYDIPAGTYTPAAFYNLMCGFFTTPLYSSGGTTSYRTAANAFTVTVNNKTYAVPAGRRIAFGNIGASSPYGIVQTNFNGDAAAIGISGTGRDFSVYGYYLTYTQHRPPNFMLYYANFPITITTGIKFA